MSAAFDDGAAREAILRSGYFDPVYYRRERDDLSAVDDLLGHYLERGWREHLNPSAWFDTDQYLLANDDVAASGMNPLVHFAAFGQAEGRTVLRPEIAPPGAPARPALPSHEEWAALPARAAPADAVVDVIVPVYRGFAETMRCLFSVLAAPVETRYELCVIDDASPEPELAAALDNLAAAGRISLSRNAENAGFIRSVNAAMDVHPTRDVVLLNADTEVFPGWLDRLRAAAAQPDVGTVTPFSNNGEVCSYPAFLRDNDRLLEMGDAELDLLMAHVNRGMVEDLPTAVGFCMYVRRACLDAIGRFDEVRFGRGYGEENDFSRRAAAAGWRNVLAADVFVRHYGARSFGTERTALARAALETLEQLHPGYSSLIRAFSGADPARPLRERVDIARLHRARRGRTFLFVTHNRGGGTERHVRALAERIVAGGDGVLFCRATNRSGNRLRIESPAIRLPNVRTFDIPDDLESFTTMLNELGIDHVHVHHLADLPAIAADFLRVAIGRARIAYDVTIHDYLFVCPRITLIDASGFYCGEPEEAGCAHCLARSGSEFGAPPIWEWRDRSERFLGSARSVFVPDDDVARRLRRYFPGVACTVRPHRDDAARMESPAAAQHGWATAGGRSAPRRIGVIGAIGGHKGSRLLLECARIARERGAPIAFTVIGYTDIDDALAQQGVAITGPYAENELPQRIAHARIDVAWFCSVWPETYSYTFSAALHAGVFPVTFDIGAVAARVRAIGWGTVLPLEWFFDAERLVDVLTTVQTSPQPPVPAAQTSAGASFVADYYSLPDPPVAARQ